MQAVSSVALSEHKIKGSVIISRILFFIILVVVSIVAFYSMNTYFDAELLADLPEYYQYVAFLPALMAVLLLLQTISLFSKRIIIYEDGIGNGKQKWTWDDVTWFRGTQVNHYYLFIPVGKTYNFTILFKDNKRLAIDSDYARDKKLFDILNVELGKLNFEQSPYGGWGKLGA